MRDGGRSLESSGERRTSGRHRHLLQSEVRRKDPLCTREVRAEQNGGSSDAHTGEDRAGRRIHLSHSMISGEPIPIEKDKDAKVTAGTVNGTGGFVMRAERVGADTLLAQIVKMVSEAQRSRAPIQRLADRVSSYFVPAVIISAVITFAVWYGLS